ncbi:glycogen-binding domain-containing protein [Thermodesulfobacteriota bacterium]
MASVKSKKNIRRRKITFTLDLSGAKEVILMGDFNNWDPKKHSMKSDENGIWTKAVMLFPGNYEYKFLVDGEWKEDPQNEHKNANCFGTYNSIFNLAVSQDRF